MLKITVKSIRPNAGVPFYAPSAEYKAWFKANYIDAGLCNQTSVKSADGLSMTTVVVWQDAAQHDAFDDRAEAKAMFAAREAYNNANGISRTANRENV